jgi:hypothetical protein
MSDPYLIWSHEHKRWWGPGESGYTRHVSQAGRYSHADAVAICAKAIPGNAKALGALPELPVRLSDVERMTELHKESMSTWGRTPEREEWE